MTERKISDVDLERLRRLHADGRSLTDLAIEFRISRQHAGRLARGDRRPLIAAAPDVAEVPAGAGAAVERFLAGLELDAGDLVLAATARALAAKLDACSASDSSAAAQAVPRLAGELVEVLDRLLEGRPRAPDELDALQARRAARLFGPPRDTNGFAS